MNVLLLLLIGAFPLLLGGGFVLGSAAGMALPGRGLLLVGRSAHMLYVLLLAALLGLALAAGGDIAAGGGWFDADGAAHAAVLVLVGVVTGAALFWWEFAASVGLRRATRRLQGRRQALMEGATASLRQAGTSYWFVPVALAIGTAEEVLWRGYLLDGLVRLRGTSPWGAVVVTAVSFGLTHYFFGLRNILLKTVDGAVWGVLALLSGGLLAPIVSHATFNACAWARLRR